MYNNNNIIKNHNKKGAKAPSFHLNFVQYDPCGCIGFSFENTLKKKNNQLEKQRKKKVASKAHPFEIRRREKKNRFITYYNKF